jgi:dTDP-glucose 4,6-dehydratase
MIMNILEEKSLPVYGDGKQVRDWLYVADHCDALMKVFEGAAPGETYNIGCRGERQNIQLIELLCDLLDNRLGRRGSNSSRRLITFVTDRPGHDRRYAIDPRKIEKELGWEPKYGFEKALGLTLDWYLANSDWVERVRSGEYRRWMESNYSGRALIPN